MMPIDVHRTPSILDPNLLLGRPDMGIVNLEGSSVNHLTPLRLANSLTLVANFRLVRLSLRCACSGLIITNISVFELPPSEYCRRYVNCPRS
jgi:hypothetical protein